MKLYLRPENDMLKPADYYSAEAIKGMHNDQCYRCEVKQPRRINFHRKFFLLVKTVFDMQEKYTDMNDVRDIISISAGYCTTIYLPDGNIYKRPNSVSFAKMDQSEFEEYYKAFLQHAVKFLEYINENKYDRSVIEDMIDSIIDYF